MAGQIASLLVKIGADISELESSLSRAQRSIEDTGKRMTQMGKTISTRVTAPLTALGAVAVRAFGQQEKAELRLRAALRANGRQVEELFGQYNSFAKEMQRTTVVGDETTLAMLAQAESLGITGDAAQRAVRNSIAMQSAFGVNAQSALRYTAALEEGNASMLTRYLPALREIDDESERVAKAQEMLANAFSSAEAEAQGAAGQFTQMRNALGDMMEVVGEIVAEAIMPLINRIKEMAETFQSLNTATQRSVVGFAAVAAAIGPVLLVGGKLLTWGSQVPAMFTKVSKGLTKVRKAFSLVLSPIFLKIAAIAALILVGKSIVDTFEPLQRFFSKLWDGIASAFESATNFIIGGWNKVKEVISNVVPGITATVVESVSWMNEQTGGKLGEFADNLKGNLDSALEFVTGFASGAVDAIGDFIFATDQATKSVERLNQATEESAAVTRQTEAVQESTREVTTGLNTAAQSLDRLVGAGHGMREVSGSIDKAEESVNRLSDAQSIAMGIANDFTASFGHGMANVFVHSERLLDSLKNIGKLLASAAIQKGLSILLTGGLSGAGFFGAGGGLFGKIIGVNDALIRPDGSVIKFHPDDSILAMKDFSGLGGAQNVHVTVEGALRGEDIFISGQRGGNRFRR